MTEEIFVRELELQAEAARLAPLSLHDVQGRARRVRRTRRVLAAASVAAVAAVAVPLALVAGTGADRADRTPAPVDTPTRAVDPNAPALSYLADGVLHRADGSTVRPQLTGAARAYVELGDERVVFLTSSEDGMETRVEAVDADGRPLGAWASGWTLAVDPAATTAAWIGPGGVPMVLDLDDDEPRELPALGGSEPKLVSVTAGCADPREHCSVLATVAGTDGVPGPTWMSTEGGDTEAVFRSHGGPRWLADASPAGGTPVMLWRYAGEDNRVCAGVLSGNPDRPVVWESCQDNVYRFSPDGTHLLSMFGEGMGPNSFRIRESRTGDVVAEQPLVDGVVAQAVWEDTDSVVAALSDGGQWSLVRLEVSGRRTVLRELGPAEPDGSDVPLLLPGRR